MDEIRLIGTNSDGALLSSNQNTSQKNIRMMKHLPEDRFPLTCSGREVEDANNIPKKSGLGIPAVRLNSSVGLDGEEKIFESSFDKNDARKIDPVLSKLPTKIYTNLGGYKSQNYKNRMKEIFREVRSEFSIKELNYELEYEKSICSIPYNNIEEVIEKNAIGIYKFFILIPNRQLKANIFNHLKKMLNVSVTESVPVNIEIVSQNASKGVVFDRLGSIYNLKRSSRIAIGDSLNDLSVFESIDISLAIGNSYREIMKKTDYVTVPNDKDGVSQAFERIFTMQTN